MKHLFTLITILSMSALMQAQIAFIDNFDDYTNGESLETTTELSVTEWYRSLKSSMQAGASPTISSGALTYTSYPSSGVGNSIVCTGDSDDRTSTHRVLSETISGNLYAAVLVNFTSASTSFKDFLSWEASTGSNFSRGRVFVKYDSTTEQLYFGVSKKSGSSTYITSTSSSYALNTTHLVVLKYETDSESDGDDDLIKIYVNPDMSLETANTAVTNNIIENSDGDEAASDYTGSTIGLNIRQQTDTNYSLSNIRVATNWANLFDATITTGIFEAPLNEELSLFVSGNSITNNENQDGELTIFNLSGCSCLTQNITATETITVNLPDGVYVVKFKGTDGTIKTTKTLIR